MEEVGTYATGPRGSAPGTFDCLSGCVGGTAGPAGGSLRPAATSHPPVLDAPSTTHAIDPANAARAFIGDPRRVQAHYSAGEGNMQCLAGILHNTSVNDKTAAARKDRAAAGRGSVNRWKRRCTARSAWDSSWRCTCSARPHRRRTDSAVRGWGSGCRTGFPAPPAAAGLRCSRP